MADDNVSNAIKNLNDQITRVDRSLSNMMNRYDDFKKSLSKDNEKNTTNKFKSLETGVNTARTAIRNLVSEIKNLKKSTSNPEGLKRLDSLLRQLNMSYAALARVTATVNRGQQNLQALGDRVARAFERGQKTLAAFNNEQVRGAAASNEMKQGLAGMRPLLQRIGYAFGIAFSVNGLVQFGKKLVETRGEFELQQVALRSILQNKQLADEIWDKTMQAALQSPFTAMQLTTYTKQLAAYRIETDKLFDTTKRLADVSAGLGVDMQRLILAYGQVKAANYLRASEIRQFTEAGVNILGELSTYLSATRGELISTAQVMDMVQKRMVKFEDVEAIFKRMTDEGGIFYNMQYVQSQTVKGQINKLHDAYDQMLNSIGKANQGTLKNMVSIMLNIIKYWREWKTVLDTIAIPAIIIAIIRFGKGLVTLGASARIASKEIMGLELAGTKLRKGLGKTLELLKKFPGGVAGAAGAFVAFAAVSALYNHAKAVDAINKEYDEQKNRLRETARSLEDYQNRINENNEIIKNKINISKNDKEGQEKLLEAQKDNKSIIAKLTNDYPEFAKSIKLAADKQADLGSIVNDTNAKLRDQVALLEASKAGYGYDDLKTNIEEYQASALSAEEAAYHNYTLAQNAYQDFLDERERKEAEYRQQYEDGQIKSAKKLQKKIDELYKKEPPSWVKIILDAGNNPQKQAAAMVGNVVPADIKDPSGTTYEGPLGVIGLGKSVSEREKDLRESLQRLGLRIRVMYKNELEKLNNGAIEDARAFVAQHGTLVDAWFEYGSGSGWKYLNERVVSLASQLGVSIDEARKIVEDEVNRTLMSAYGKTIKIDWSKQGGENTTIETPEERQGRIDAAWRRRIQLLEEMKKRYDELSESAYGYAKSNTTVRTEFEKSWNKIFGGVLSMNAIRFMTDEDMESAFETLLSKAGGASEAIKEELQKKSDSYGAKKPIEIAVRVREDFGKQIEQMFNNYDLTLDLEKLSLPTGELSGIFDFDITTLKDIRKQIDSFYNEKIALGEDPKKLEKQMEGYYKKIDEMERKSLIDRLKKYTQYLTQGRDDAVQIHLEELKAMSELDELYAKGYYTRVQYQSISDKIRKETNEKLSKNEWKEFKESEYYVTMFEDLSNVADDSIDLMLSKLKVLKGRLKDLDPTQVKEIVNSIEKLEKTQRERSPLKTFLNDFRTQREWRQNYDKNINKLGLYSDNESTWLAVRDSLREEVASLTQEYNKLSLDGILGNEKDTKEKLDRRQEQLDYVNKVLEEIRSNIAEINKENNEGYGAWQRTYKGIAVGAQFMSDMASNVGTISTEMLDMFDGVDDATKKLSHDIAEIAGNVGLLVKDIVDAIKSKGTDVGAMIDGLVRTWNIIKGAMSASEAGINRTIEIETNSLRDLEESLDRVQRARDKAWDVEMVRKSEREIEEAIYSQIEAYDALIAAESQRKNPDDENLRQWRNEREELYQKLEEERERFIQEFGGIGESGYLSAAQNFVDAWKQAFLETSDGLQGLQDHFDEFLQEWFVKQATMRIAGKMLEPVFKAIDDTVSDKGPGGANVLLSELQGVRDMFATVAPNLSAALEELAGMWNLDGEGGLSGLAAGIQGMTEEQANILEAYWNSVRMYTASIDSNVSRIAEILGAGGVNTNPQLTQLQLIQENTRAISNLLSATTKSGHPQGGYGIKVFND